MIEKDYKRTKRACYLGFVTQAIVANFTPLLFIDFHREYDIPIARLALIPAVFYVVQLFTDFLCAKFKNLNYRRSIIISEIASAFGLIGLTFLPALFSDPLVGILISVCIYAVGSTQVFKFIRNLARHFADHGRFAVHNLIMGKYQHEFFTVGVDHTEGQLTMVLASEIRIQMHIARKIIHPAHIPFQIKTKSVLFNRLCYLRPCSRFFCDHDNADAHRARRYLSH